MSSRGAERRGDDRLVHHLGKRMEGRERKAEAKRGGMLRKRGEKNKREPEGRNLPDKIVKTRPFLHELRRKVIHGSNTWN